MVEFARSLLFDGRLILGTTPRRTWDADAERIARSALEIQSLHLAGPPLDGSIDVLKAALAVVHRFAWRLCNPEPVPVGDDPTLRMPTDPRTPGEHLAGDVALRFMSPLLRRTRNANAEDPLVGAMVELLQRWPLSGVLADVNEAPLTPTDFGGHPGLGFWYAQRLAAHDRPAWHPVGPARECVELVWSSLGKPS